MLKIDFDPPLDQLRQFGWVSLIGFPLIGAVLHFWNGWVPVSVFWVLVGVGVLVFAAAMAGLWPVVRTVFLGLMFVAIPIGFVLSTVLLGALYYLMFTPLALWFKLRGRDTMRRKLEPDAKSYWDHRKGSAPSKRYLRMY